MNAIRRYPAIIVLALLCVLAPRAGLAQGDTATAVSEADAALARKYLDEGVEAYQSNDFETARDKFRRSFNLKRSYDTALNLGNTELKLELYRDAAEHLDYATRHYPTAENQDRKKKIERILDQVRDKVGSVRVSVDTPGATVFIDQHPVGTSPLSYELFVEEGTHEVRAELEGEVVSAQFEAKKGETSAVTLNFEESGAVFPRSGIGVGRATEVDETTPRKRNWTPAWILGGATVATLGTSMVFRGLAGSATKKHEDLTSTVPEDGCRGGSSLPEACGDIDKYMSRGNTQATVSDVTLVAGAVLGAATIGYVLFTVGKSPQKERSVATFSLERGGASLSFSGYF